MTKSIPLTQGKFALVDDEDYDWLMNWKWYYKKDKAGNGYAVRHDSVLVKRKLIPMHRVILNAPDGVQVDHINNNRADHGLYNQRSNLRICTNAENQANVGIQSNNTSGYKGVTLDKRTNHWRAQIIVNRKRISIGFYKNPQDAARAYDQAALKYFGKFANINGA
jgi:hypothetical protein